MKNFLCYSLLLLVLVACQKKVEYRHNDIHKIEFAYGGGGCMTITPSPALYFIIDSTLTYTYYGDKHADMPGYWETKLSREQWDRLCWALECSSYKSVPDSAPMSTASIMEFYIHHSNGVKHIYGNNFQDPWMSHIIGQICTSPTYLPLRVSDYTYFRCTAASPPLAEIKILEWESKME